MKISRAIGLGMLLAAGVAVSASMADAKKNCITKKTGEQTDKSSQLGASAAVQAQLACNLEFRPCDENAKGAACRAVIEKYAGQ